MAEALRERPPTVDEVVKRHALATLATVGGHKGRAAELLGVSLKTVYNWVEKWEMEPAPEPAPPGDLVAEIAAWERAGEW